MRRTPANDPLALDDASVERLLSGTLPPSGAPPGYAGVARLLAAAVAPPTSRELAGEAAALAELRAVTRARRAAAVRPPRPRPRPRRRRAGLAVVVLVGALATGGVAAATGHLPGPVREAARGVLGPGGAATSQGPASSAASGTTGSGGTDPGGSPSTVGSGPRSGSAAAGPAAEPALDGLCQAFQEGNGGEQGEKLDTPAFEELVRAAGGAGNVPAFCEDLLAADAKAKKPEEPTPKDPPDDPGQGQSQGGPPATTGGSGNGSGSGSGGGQAAAASPPNRG